MKEVLITICALGILFTIFVIIPWVRGLSRYTDDDERGPGIE